MMTGEQLSPILVKELRQGMRARVFEGSFLLLQVLMVFAIVIALLTVDSQRPGASSTTFGHAMFWAMVAIPVLLIMPMRGCNALKTEIDAKSLELIFLTRLSAWRIVAGKWGALFSQTCLLVTAVLPYAVLRYYLGSVDLVGDLMVIGGMLGASALLTAFTVSCSAFSSRLARSMIFIFPVALLNIAPALGFVTMASRVSYGSASSVGIGVYGAYLFYGLIALLYLLEIGASQIAPPAENHAVRKRLLGLFVLISGPGAVWLGASQDLLIVTFCFVLVVCLEAVCGQWDAVPGVYLPLFRLGRIGRRSSVLFVPGWPSGVLYSIITLGSFFPILFLTGRLDEDIFTVYVASVGALFMPLAFVRIFAPRTHRLGTLYWSIQLLIVIGTMIVLLINGLLHLDVEEILSIFPLATLILAVAGEADASWLPATLIVLFASLGVIFFLGPGAWRELRLLKARALALYGTETTAPPAAPGAADS